MRIVSSFHDYYDKGIGFGIDPKLIFVREKQEFVSEKLAGSDECKLSEADKIALEPIYAALKDRPTCDGGTVAFCGKLYPFYSLDVGGGIIFYNFARLLGELEKPDFVQKYNSFSKKEDKLVERAWLKTLRDKYHSLAPEKTIVGKHGSKSFMSHTEYDATFYGKSIGDDLFRHFNSPIVVMLHEYVSYYPHKLFLVGANRHLSNNGARVIVNPNLRQYNFNSQFDPMMAFQEISMYLGSNLAKQMDPNVNLSDEDRAETHGFDKWSFRKPGKHSR